MDFLQTRILRRSWCSSLAAFASLTVVSAALLVLPPSEATAQDMRRNSTASPQGPSTRPAPSTSTSTPRSSSDRGGYTGQQAPTPSAVRSEWDTASEIVYDPRVRECRDTQLLSDALQIAAAAMDRNLRQGAELSAAESEQIGDALFETLAQHPDSPMFRRVDPPARERDRQYIESVGRLLLVNLQRDGITYEFHLVDMAIPNAFAIPGGHIFVTTALFDDRQLVENEAQLAAILAHEIGHVDLRHTSAVYETIRAAGFDVNDPAALQASQLFAQIIRALYQSEFEDESDEYAVKRLFELGYSPFQFVRQWVNWSQVEGMTSSHGPTAAQQAPTSGGTLADEVRNVLQSHNTPIVRACNTASLIEDIRQNYERQSYYVGYRNLADRVSAGQRTY